LTGGFRGDNDNDDDDGGDDGGARTLVRGRRRFVSLIPLDAIDIKAFFFSSAFPSAAPIFCSRASV
jgi:hypothetical protein